MTDTPPPVTTVLLAAAGSAVEHALRAAVARGAVVLAAVARPQDARDVVSSARPQVVVVDVGPGGGAGGAVGGGAGGAALAAVGVVGEERPVLTVSAAADHTLVLAAVQAGATGHLVAPYDPADLAVTLRRTARGEAVFSPGLAELVLDAVGAAGTATPPRDLTARETAVLALVADGLTARQIAGRLVLSPRTVENHVQSLLRKVGAPNRAALVRYAIEHGLV